MCWQPLKVAHDGAAGLWHGGAVWVQCCCAASRLDTEGRLKGNQMPTIPLQYRYIDTRATESPEYAFIIHSWLKSYEKKAVYDGYKPKSYYQVYHPFIGQLMKENRVALASLMQDADCFVGWACGTEERLVPPVSVNIRPPLLNYVYVKSPYRRNGIAKDLVRQVAGLNAGTFTFESLWYGGFHEYLKKQGWQLKLHQLERDDNDNQRTGKQSTRESDKGTAGAEESEGGSLQK